MAKIPRGKTHKNWKEIRRAAERGDAAAQYNLAWKFEEDADAEQAQKWLLKAAEQGHVLAHYRLAFLRKDPAHQLEWLKRGAELGSAHCQCDLGIMYWEGHYGPKDDILGTRWILAAAAQNFHHAEYLLFRAYQNGRGVEADPKKAIDYLRKACEHGDGYAMPLLAEFLANGTNGAEQDLVEAHMWMTLGMPDRQDRDYPAYQAERDALAQRMTPSQIQEARCRSRQWRPTEPSALYWTGLYYGAAETWSSRGAF